MRRDVAFGELLRTYRIARGFSQEALAERARMSVAAIGALERGSRRAPYASTVDLIVSALGLSGADRETLESAAAGARKRQPSHTRGLPEPAGNLPRRPTSFIGRDSEVARVAALLQRHQLVTLTGPGGVGKTRHATEVARGIGASEHREVWFVELAPVTSGTFVASAIAAVLGISLGAGADEIAVLAASLRRRQCLIVLDNCEHVIVAAAAAAAAILRECPHVTILATSRERLDIEGECVFRMSFLNAGDSIALLTDRATAADAHLVLTAGELQTGARICLRLGGLPLAIELIASRVPVLGMEVVFERLKDHLAIAGGRDRPERHQTMLATIAWSYDLLAADEQMLLRRLAIFRGPASLEAIEATCSSPELPRERIATAVESLVGKSLVEPMTDADPKRYGMLESVRTFGLERLAAADELTLIARAHAERLVMIADRAHEDMRTVQRDQWLIRFLPELDDVRAALEWSLQSDDDEVALLACRIVGGLRAMWLNSNRNPELRTWTQTVLLRLDEERYPEVSARLMRALIQTSGGDEQQAVTDRAIPLFTRIGDMLGIATAYMQAAFNHSRYERFAEAGTAIDRAFAAAGAESPSMLIVHGNLFEARCIMYMRAGDVERAEADLRERSRCFALLGASDPREPAHIRGHIALRKGDAPEAVIQFEQKVAFDVEMGRNPAGPLCDLALAQLVLGHADQAADAARRALDAAGFEGEETGLSAVEYLAGAAALRGDPVIAARLRGFYDSCSERNGVFRDWMRRLSFDIVSRSLSEQLDAAAIARYAGEGALMSVDQAVELALTVSNAVRGHHGQS